MKIQFVSFSPWERSAENMPVPNNFLAQLLLGISRKYRFRGLLRRYLIHPKSLCAFAILCPCLIFHFANDGDLRKVHDTDLIKAIREFETKMSDVAYLPTAVDNNQNAKIGRDFFQNCYRFVDGGPLDQHFDVNSECYKNIRITRVEGFAKNGKLHGWCTLHEKDGTVVKGRFTNGILNGIVRKYRCKYGTCDISDDNNVSKPTFLAEVL